MPSKIIKWNNSKMKMLFRINTLKESISIEADSIDNLRAQVASGLHGYIASACARDGFGNIIEKFNLDDIVYIEKTILKMEA